MAFQQISSADLVDGTVNTADIAANAVTGDKLGLTSINANNIVNGGVTVDKGGTGLSTLTSNNVILGNGTAAVQFVAPGTSGNVLTSNGNNWISQSAAAGGGDYIMQVFTSPGTWTKPAGLKAIKVTVIGGGGAAGDSPAPGRVGGTSSFGSPAFLSATGGAGSITGGSGSGGTINVSGGRGGSSPSQCGVGLTIGGEGAFGFGVVNINQYPSPASLYNPGANYGAGASLAGGGGGAIEYIDAPALPGPQPYTVGSGGSGPYASGGAGVIIVEEFY